MSENDEKVREAWAVLRRFGQVPLPVDEDGVVHNPRVILRAVREDQKVSLVPAKGPEQSLWFYTEGAAQEFIEAIMMHWSLVR